MQQLLSQSYWVTSLKVFIEVQDQTARMAIIILAIVVALPQIGGYAGVCILSLTPRILSYQDNRINVLLMAVILLSEVGLYSSTGQTNWGLLVGTPQVSVSMYGGLMFIRPVLTALLLALVLIAERKRGLSL